MKKKSAPIKLPSPIVTPLEHEMTELLIPTPRPSRIQAPSCRVTSDTLRKGRSGLAQPVENNETSSPISIEEPDARFMSGNPRIHNFRPVSRTVESQPLPSRSTYQVRSRRLGVNRDICKD